MTNETDIDAIKQWRSILTLVVFVLINGPILWPFRVPLYVPRVLLDGFARFVATLRLCQPEQICPRGPFAFVRLGLPVNYVTAPLMATIVLLATSTIGWQEVRSGIVGNDNTGITPYDVVLVFLTLGYVANSIAASGFVRYLVHLVLRKSSTVGHRLYLYLYLSFFGLGMFIGNDPIMLLFLSSLTKVTANVRHPRAWVHTQFAIANVATGVLVSSNPTNLVLAGAFNIKFVGYMTNMIVPTVVTSLLLFPYLLYIIFHDESLIPSMIEVYALPDEIRNRPPVNINIPFGRGEFEYEDEVKERRNPEAIQFDIEPILNPWLSRKSAVAGSAVMVASVVILLALNAVYLSRGGNTDFWVTLPAAFFMVWWDVVSDWAKRRITRRISREGRQRAEIIFAERAERRRSICEENRETLRQSEAFSSSPVNSDGSVPALAHRAAGSEGSDNIGITSVTAADPVAVNPSSTNAGPDNGETVRSADVASRSNEEVVKAMEAPPEASVRRALTNLGLSGSSSLERKDFGKERVTLVALLQDGYVWLRETFTTTTVAATYLPWDIIPFAFSMFTLVEALVSKGWMPVFGRGWDWWATHTGVVGSIAGMGFLGAVLSNIAGTNIGACILMSQVIKSWQDIHRMNGIPISDRLFWGSVYSLSIGVNYGAFSLSISASLTGIMWRTVLNKEGRRLGKLEFARVNLPMIAMAMLIACSVLVAQVHITRSAAPYDA